MRDYDRLTPKERADQAKPTPTKHCSKCGDAKNFHGSCDQMEWLLDRWPTDGSYLRKCLTCGNVERTTREELTAAHARDSDPPPTPTVSTRMNESNGQDCAIVQEESVDETVTDTGVSLRQATVFASLMGRVKFRSPAETLWDAQAAYDAGDLTKEQFLEVINAPPVRRETSPVLRWEDVK